MRTKTDASQLPNNSSHAPPDKEVCSAKPASANSLEFQHPDQIPKIEENHDPQSGSLHTNSFAPTFIYKSLKIAVGVTLLIALFATRYIGLDFAAGVLGGGVWNIANLWLITLLVTTIFVRAEQEDLVRRKRGKLILLATIKFPLLYGVGLAVLIYGNLSTKTVGGILTGFSILFIIIILRVIGRILVERGILGTKTKQVTTL